jgi:trans-aconitate 2-methyltransferase
MHVFMSCWLRSGQCDDSMRTVDRHWRRTFEECPVSRPSDSGNHDAKAVQSYYNEFADSRMLGYLDQPNLRLEKAIATVLPLVERNARILDIGCGIGLVTERIASAAAEGTVWACDISDRNIEIASQRMTMPNVVFRVVDIISGFEDLRSWVGAPVHFITLIDVIEHIPLDAHPELLGNLHSMMTPDGALCATFPSPAYQRFLHKHRPEELQIVDELVNPLEFVRRAQEAGFQLKSLTFEDVWYSSQYIHCVLRASGGLHRMTDDRCYWRAVRALANAVPRHSTVILVDEDRWDGEPLPGLRLLPFLEHEGRYWGLPASGTEAVSELARLGQAGAEFIAFPESAFWWMSTYPELAEHLRSTHEIVHEDECLLVFRLRRD